MGYPPPASLLAIINARDDNSCDAAWEVFLEEHSKLILHVSRSNGGDHDAVMDRYIFVVQALRDNEFRRLKQYASDGGGKFTTWLLVVARRLCFDHHRARYGRKQSETEAATAELSERRHLVDLISDELGTDAIEAPEGDSPDSAVRQGELRDALSRALDRVSTGDRLLLRYRFQDGLSVPEITRLSGGSSPFATYRRFEKILGELRATLEAAGIRSSVP